PPRARRGRHRGRSPPPPTSHPGGTARRRRSPAPAGGPRGRARPAGARRAPRRAPPRRGDRPPPRAPAPARSTKRRKTRAAPGRGESPERVPALLAPQGRIGAGDDRTLGLGIESERAGHLARLRDREDQVAAGDRDAPSHEALLAARARKRRRAKDAVGARLG